MSVQNFKVIHPILLMLCKNYYKKCDKSFLKIWKGLFSIFIRPGSVWNCLWRHALKRSPGINRKSRVSYPGPGLLSSATLPLLPKKHYNGLNQTKPSPYSCSKKTDYIRNLNKCNFGYGCSRHSIFSLNERETFTLSSGITYQLYFYYPTY